jgi:5-methylcytosine-specific restriction protein A
MPNSPLTLCAYPNCPELVRSGYCSFHHVLKVTYPRDPQRQALYDRRWKKRRVAWLASHPWCEDCLDQDIYTPATDVHHEIRHAGDVDLFLSSPLRGLCHACHSRRTIIEVRGDRGGLKKLSSGECTAHGANRTKKNFNVENPI